MALVTSSSNIPCGLRCKYDVFLSFNDKDTRKTFTDHLNTAFLKAGFRTFWDDDDLERGEDIKPEFKKAIQLSQSSVIVFSQNYAASGWCLDELVMTLERKRTSGLIVLPVFYHVDPHNARKQTGSVAEAFARHVKNHSVKHKVEGWKKALAEVADLAGMVLENQADGYESRFIEKIVRVIDDKLSRTPLSVVHDRLIGIGNPVQSINRWLESETTAVRILVIYGMHGIGKTALAQLVYNGNYRRFEGSSFLKNTSKSSRTPNDLMHLQQLLYDVLNRRKVKLHTVSEGKKKIEDAINSRRVLFVLDDVDHLDHLDEVIRMQGQFYPASKVIITTSNIGLLKVHHQHIKVHNVEPLDDSESLELFSWHTFGQKYPNEDYMEYSKRAVNLCEGLPLALKVLGSCLSGQSIDVWESGLKKLEAIPNLGIVDKLKLSYDSLQDDHDQNLFLHIACFFVGMDKDVIVKILDGCDFYTIIGIQNLIERCLVKVDEDNKVQMHRMIQDMGRRIVRSESKELEKRSRLWHHNDSFKVLTRKNGTGAIEGLIMDKEMTQTMVTHPRKSNVILETDAFARMQNLRLLKLSHVQLNGSYGEFPTELKWFCWNNFCFDSLPIDFPLERLVVFEMCYSNLRQVWREKENLPFLKTLNLSHSHELFETPNFSYVPNLEILILKDCANLVDVHESIGSLQRLVHLDLEDCINIRKLPHNVFMLSLKTFIISGCSNLSDFPTLEMKSLQTLKADEIPIHGVFNTSGYEDKLWPSNNPNILWASCLLPQSLVNLSLANCNLSDDKFPIDLRLPALKRVNLSSNPVTCLPSFIRGVTRLNELIFRDCPQLESLLQIPGTEVIDVTRSTLLERITGESLSETLKGIAWKDNWNLLEFGNWFKSEPIQRCEEEMTQLFGSLNFKPTDTIQVKHSYRDITLPAQAFYEQGMINTYFPGNEAPSQFSHKSKGSSLTFTVPSQPNERIQGLNVFCVYAESNIDCRSSIDDMKDAFPQPIMATVSNKSKSLMWMYGPKIYGIPVNGQHLIWLSHWKNHRNQLEGGNEVTVSVFTSSQLQVKECGIKILYEQDDQPDSTKEIRFQLQISGIFRIYYLCWSLWDCKWSFVDLDWFKYLLERSFEIADKEVGEHGEATIKFITDKEEERGQRIEAQKDSNNSGGRGWKVLIMAAVLFFSLLLGAYLFWLPEITPKVLVPT